MSTLNNTNISFMVNEEKYLNNFDNNKIFELDEFSFAPHEIFDFARQFLPKDSYFNSGDFIKKLRLVIQEERNHIYMIQRI